MERGAIETYTPRQPKHRKGFLLVTTQLSQVGLDRDHRCWEAKKPVNILLMVGEVGRCGLKESWCASVRGSFSRQKQFQKARARVFPASACSP